MKMFSPESFEDEPCDGCGVKPSVHLGHGSFTCQKCFDAQWCPECKFSIHSDVVDGKHVCQPPEVRARRKEDWDDESAVMDMDYDYVSKMRNEIRTLRARLATCKCH